jgi:hypothetical protein
LDVSGAQQKDRDAPHKAGDMFKGYLMPRIKATTTSSSINTDCVLIPVMYKTRKYFVLRDEIVRRPGNVSDNKVQHIQSYLPFLEVHTSPLIQTQIHLPCFLI